MNVEPAEAMLIATHDWDMAGAQAALISRKGQALYPLAPEPQLKEESHGAIVDKLRSL